VEAVLGLTWPWATAEKSRPRAELRSQADTKLPERALGAIALAGLKTRHYNFRAWKAQR